MRCERRFSTAARPAAVRPGRVQAERCAALPRRLSGYLPGCLCWSVLAALLCLPAGHAHPVHGSYAEIEWSLEGHLHVALHVIPEDLERALSARAGVTVALRDTPAVRELLTAYLREHFQLVGGRARREPHIVGMELDYRDTWIYFSLPAGAAPRRAPRLRNTVLMDLKAAQTNRVKRLWRPEAPVLVFSAAEPERAL